MTKLEKMKKLGLIGCLNESDITSSNYKQKIQEMFEDRKRSKREDSSFLCAKCELPFDPSDWQNDVCDKCLYKR